MAFLIYMCSCTYSTLFRVKILDYYQMVPEHHTDEATLLFVGGYLCRLTFPLCYNYLTMAGLAEGSDLTDLPVFIQYLGPAVKLTPLFGDNYNDWLPYIILIIAVIVTFHLHHRILTFLRIKNYC